MNRDTAMNMNCPLCRALKWSFFGIGLNKNAEEGVINHLLKCPKCRKEYEEYAKAIDWGEFDVYDWAAKYSRTETIKDDSSTWLGKYQSQDIVKLATSKAIREIFLKERDKNFSKFLIKKMCQKLDHLDLCYNKDGDNANERLK